MKNHAYRTGSDVLFVSIRVKIEAGWLACMLSSMVIISFWCLHLEFSLVTLWNIQCIILIINMIICSYITFLLMIHFPSFLWLNKGFHYACVSHFLIQYPFVGNLHWFHNLAIMARSAKNTDNLNASLWCADLEFCGKIPRSGIAGS